jgi:anti-sigma factor RsiW
MADIWTSRLSEYLDGDLTADERAAIEAHLDTCAECARIVGELRAVAARAAALAPRPPAVDLWAGVHARLQPRGGAGRRTSSEKFSFTWPELAAAGLALMVLSGSAVWIAEHGGRATSMEPTAAATRTSAAMPEQGSVPVAFVDPHYDRAIADLEEAIDNGRSRLDPQTVRIVERNLAAIDRAIEDSRRALARDPANTYLNRHLAEARQRKLDLLRQAAALTTMAKGS